jgi:hypothetical protein
VVAPRRTRGGLARLITASQQLSSDPAEKRATSKLSRETGVSP